MPHGAGAGCSGSVPDAKQVTPAAGSTMTFSDYEKIEAPTADWQQARPSEPESGSGASRTGY